MDPFLLGFILLRGHLVFELTTINNKPGSKPRSERHSLLACTFPLVSPGCIETVFPECRALPRIFHLDIMQIKKYAKGRHNLSGRTRKGY